MSEELIKSVQEMLNEEKWTRATISNYTKNNFMELAKKVEEARNENCIDEVKSVCDEHLAHTKNSIIALYISGMLGLKKKSLDNSSIVELVTIFVDNHKTPIVEYLCECIIAEDETNKFALRTLADCYKEDNNPKIWETYESIVKLDNEEADIAKILAEHFEQESDKQQAEGNKQQAESDKQQAIEYYKKALHRFVTKKSNNQIKEVWSKLVSLIPDEIDFFLLVQRKIAKTISEDKSAVLMQELYAYYKDTKNWDIAIDILKLLLQIDEKDQWARKELVECYRGKYENHSQLDECIKVSSISQSWRNVFDAISDFEKHIAFDKGNYVFHRSWGVGRIRKVTKDTISINFGKKIGVKEMTLEMAIDVLQPLASDHIWVKKATKSKEELVKEIKTDQKGALKTIIKSFDNNCDFKRIKAELVPSILSTGEWTSWSTKARKILDEDSTFGVNPNDITMYTVREREIPIEEKLSNEFKAQKNFFARIDILMKFANNDDADTDSELFVDMFNYFTNYLRAFSSVNEQTIAAYLVVRKISTEHPQLAQNEQYSFAALFAEIENPAKMYESLKDTANTSLRKDYLNCIRTLLPNWNEVYIELFPTVLSKDMIENLLKSGYKEDVKKLAIRSFESYKDYREAAIFFFKESQNEDWFKEANISYEKQIITLVHIMDICYKEIDGHTNTTENRKIIKQIETLLFKNDTALNYIIDKDYDTITRIFTLIEDVKDIDPAIKIKMRNKILDNHKDFKFYGTEEKIVAPKGLMVTQKKYSEKTQLLEHITTIDIPANAKEIGEALEKGDLRENAEYKAARERQAQLNNQATKLRDEIAKATIFDTATVTTSRVSFGTKVSLKNNFTNETEGYTILGPWESDPDNNIISYMSPLGNAILNAKEGETLTPIINESKRSYTVMEISVAKI